jgi:hypothetical protein
MARMWPTSSTRPGGETLGVVRFGLDDKCGREGPWWLTPVLL